MVVVVVVVVAVEKLIVESIMSSFEIENINDISINDDNEKVNNVNDTLIVELLEAGLFEYLQTNSIVELLQSSRMLNSFTGIAISYHN